MFLFALLTDRAFLLDWKMTSTSLSKKVNDEGRLTVPKVDTLFKKPYNMETGSKDYWTKFLCGDLDVNFPEDVISFSSWDYFAIFMYHNPMYRDKITEWFGSPDNAYAMLVRFLFQPTDDIQKRIDNFVADNFRPHTVGVHLRTKGNAGYVMEKEHEEVAFQCAGISFGDSANPVGQASELFPGIRNAVNENDFAIFLASDSDDVVKRARERYGSRIITLDGVKSRANVDGIQHGLMDMWILARCNDVVISFQSSYSRSAAALAGMLPLVVSKDGKCMRDVSNELCSCGWVHIKSLKCYDSKIHDTPYSVNQVGCSTCDGLSRWKSTPLH